MNSLTHPLVPPLLVTVLLACRGLCPQAHAVSPPPDGAYPGGNTAEGQDALLSLTSGQYNTAIGYFSLRMNSSNSFNTAIGVGTLLANVADQNTAIGAAALLSNTVGEQNTAIGSVALVSNTSGTGNTATGSEALQINTIGQFNTATGAAALFGNVTGGFNTAIGFGALVNNTTASFNTAVGDRALSTNNSSNGNTAVGHAALMNNTAAGNTALGYNAGNALTTGDNNIDIGANVVGVAGESNTIRIGNTNINSTFIRGINGTTLPNGVQVFASLDGQLGTTTSSARFKQAIKPMNKCSEVLYGLRPVTFRYKQEIDPAGTSQFGLVAEEVEKVDPELVVRDEHGKPYTVRYDQVNAMLLNEFLKDHRKLEQLNKSFNSRIAEQQKQIEALTTGLQKVTAELELHKQEPRTVLNDRWYEKQMSIKQVESLSSE
jgi:hypothetical protein